MYTRYVHPRPPLIYRRTLYAIQVYTSSSRVMNMSRCEQNSLVIYNIQTFRNVYKVPMNVRDKHGYDT